MKKYRVSAQETKEFVKIINADTVEDAREKFMKLAEGGYIPASYQRFDVISVEHTGDYIAGFSGAKDGR
ncbi:MAG: hypothetical protein AABY07_01115 [Nanoarchaeota archaeon]